MKHFSKEELTERIFGTDYGTNGTLVKPVTATVDEEKNTVEIIFMVTENVGTKEQETYEQIGKFDVVEDFDRYREWLRLDEITDTEIEVYHWTELFNARQKKEAQA